jgi:hypothetical protein
MHYKWSSTARTGCTWPQMDAPATASAQHCPHCTASSTPRPQHRPWASQLSPTQASVLGRSSIRFRQQCHTPTRTCASALPYASRPLSIIRARRYMRRWRRLVNYRRLTSNSNDPSIRQQPLTSVAACSALLAGPDLSEGCCCGYAPSDH